MTLKTVSLKVLSERASDFVPKYESDCSAGMDLRACLPEGVDELVVRGNSVELVGTGLALFLGNSDYFAGIYPRSGLGHKHGIVLGNGTGIIDADYQGELKISVWNRSNEPYKIKHGDRIAQLVIMPVCRPQVMVVNEFDETTKRGEGGFGSTGVK